jgi:hypothetical protein
MSIARASFTGWWLTPSPRMNRPPVSSAIRLAPFAQV